ncbi:hypothetical protein [Synechococcus sp. CS-1328]|uniref:hypothetical protein n=1 Tax=Synechococcus sp. CS-1328 TaxID=2847976 RepID=UPI00223B88BC|nr:hypothetical protein [Synechococcus sp. CS-1328]MCT0225371.1 hypothetical protein [Synechococcus sp. CS-1328]
MPRRSVPNLVRAAIAMALCLSFGASGVLVADAAAGKPPEDFGRWETAVRDCQWQALSLEVAPAQPDAPAPQRAARVTQRVGAARPANRTQDASAEQFLKRPRPPHPPPPLPSLEESTARGPGDSDTPSGTTSEPSAAPAKTPARAAAAPLKAAALPKANHGSSAHLLVGEPADGAKTNRGCQSLRLDQLMEGLLSIQVIGSGRGSRFASEQLIFVGFLEPGSASLQCQEGRCSPQWPLLVKVSTVASRSYDEQGLITRLPSSRLARGECRLDRHHFLCEAHDGDGGLWRVEGNH